MHALRRDVPNIVAPPAVVSTTAETRECMDNVNAGDMQALGTMTCVHSWGTLATGWMQRRTPLLSSSAQVGAAPCSSLHNAPSYVLCETCIIQAWYPIACAEYIVQDCSIAGFGNSQEDYLAPGGRLEMGLAARLEARGFRVEVMPLRRRDW